MNAPNLIAQDNRRRLRNAGVLAIKLCGGIECGKTSLIRAALGHCPEDRRVAVLSSGLESHHAESHWVPAESNVDEPVTAGQVQTALGGLDLQELSLVEDRSDAQIELSVDPGPLINPFHVGKLTTSSAPTMPMAMMV